MAQKISDGDLAGLRVWRDTSREFLDDQFPRQSIELGFVAIDGATTLRATIQPPIRYDSGDLQAGFDILGITQVEFPVTTRTWPRARNSATS